MPLSMMEQGDAGRITEFHGQEEMKRRLQDLGFIQGESVRVVGENDLNGERCKDCTESGIGQPYYGGKLGGG